jgi:hypothetical protein
VAQLCVAALDKGWAIAGEPRLDLSHACSPECINIYGLVSKPVYFNYSPEVSELMLNDDPKLFDNFMIFAERVYRRIKAVHPDLQLLISVALKRPDSTDYFPRKPHTVMKYLNQ